MSFAPRHDYQQYQATIRGPRLELLRNMAVDEKFHLYAGYFDCIKRSSQATCSEEDRQQHVEDKLALRHRLLPALTTECR
jgi:hypothetical protein